MSAIDPIVSDVLAAQQASYQSKLQVALQVKRLDVVRQQGAAMLEMLSEAAKLGPSLDGGRLLDASI